MLGQVVLPQEAVQAQHPWVLHRLGKDPHVRGAPDVVVAVDQARVPLHQPLEVHVVAGRQGGGLCETEQQWVGGRREGQEVRTRLSFSLYVYDVIVSV